MRRVVLAAMLLATSVAAPTAQDALTTNQRDTDLVQLASMFAKNYAPYEWKRDVIGFDVQCNKILTAFDRDPVRLVERHLHDAAAAFLILPRAREIH